MSLLVAGLHICEWDTGDTISSVKYSQYLSLDPDLCSAL
jgi:hypothetical protein